MGIFFGRNAGAASYRYADELARKLDGKGAGRTRGGGRLLTLMRQGRDAENLGRSENLSDSLACFTGVRHPEGWSYVASTGV